MKRVSRSALVELTCEQMFDVVNDVEAYARFLPWCAGARIHEQSDSLMVATISVARAGVMADFTTRNSLHRPDRIDLDLVDGPFRALKGRWQFSPLGDVGCKAEMSLEFDFSSRMLAFTFGKVFEQAADSMVDAFCGRAEKLHG